MVKLDPVRLVRQLVGVRSEEPWVEFKENISDPEKIGRTMSALANGAALSGREKAYLVWGVRDDTYEIVGTSFNLEKAKKGNESLVNWLRSALTDNLDFDYMCCETEGKNLLIMTIGKAVGNPVLFQNVAYIRDGSYVKPLSKIPILEQKLWRRLQSYSFESSPVTDSLQPAEIEDLLDCEAVLRLLRHQRMKSPGALMDFLAENDVVARQDDGGYCVTALGAVLFAKDLTLFDVLSRRSVRLVRYGRSSKFTIEKEVELTKGYAAGFEDTERYLSLLLPSEEVIDGAERRTRYTYPLVVVRELLVNAMVHQDFMQSGMNVSLEVFDDRIVVSNPGRMLVEPDRVVNSAPVSRNEKIAGIVRRMGFCEELGSGWDRVVEACEEFLMPAPSIRCDDNGTVVTVYCARSLREMSADERVWSCYMHACLRFAQGGCMTNTSLRKRFGIEDGDSGSVTVSRVIRSARDKGMVKPSDEDAAPKNIGYVPYWA